jgi:thymidylate synthase
MYYDIDAMWKDLIEDLLRQKNGGESRDGDVCGEIIGWSGDLDASQQKTFLTNPVRKLSPAYAAAETLWYMSGSSHAEMMMTYAPSYERYARDDGTAYGAYGARIMGVWPTNDVEHETPDPRTQFQKVIDMLHKSPRSRQAVLPFWRPGDLVVAEAGTSNDIPCTLAWQFLIRDGKLDMSVAMRSNDAWLGFPYDVFAFCAFQRIVAAHLNVAVGVYRHRVIGSMHLYSRDMDKAMEAVAQKTWRAPIDGHGWALDDTIDSCRVAVELEHEMRTAGGVKDSTRMGALGGMSRDLLICAVRKLKPEWFGNADIISPRLRRHPSVDT